MYHLFIFFGGFKASLLLVWIFIETREMCHALFCPVNKQFIDQSWEQDGWYFHVIQEIPKGKEINSWRRAR